MPPLLRTLASPITASTTEKLSLENLLALIANEDAAIRTEAWRRAGEVGAPAVRPLADLAEHTDAEIARAAKRGLWRIVRHAGRPDAAEERTAVEAEIMSLLAAEPSTPIIRESIWMLSEIGADPSVGPIADLLSHAELKDDARMALERIPGDRSMQALKSAFESAAEDFKPSLAHSLRVRGVEISGYPTAKLDPTKPTGVQPIK